MCQIYIFDLILHVYFVYIYVILLFTIHVFHTVLSQAVLSLVCECQIYVSVIFHFIVLFMSYYYVFIPSSLVNSLFAFYYLLFLVISMLIQDPYTYEMLFMSIYLVLYCYHMLRLIPPVYYDAKIWCQIVYL